MECCLSCFLVTISPSLGLVVVLRVQVYGNYKQTEEQSAVLNEDKCTFKVAWSNVFFFFFFLIDLNGSMHFADGNLLALMEILPISVFQPGGRGPTWGHLYFKWGRDKRCEREREWSLLEWVDRWMFSHRCDWQLNHAISKVHDVQWPIAFTDLFYFVLSIFINIIQMDDDHNSAGVHGPQTTWLDVKWAGPVQSKHNYQIYWKPNIY